MSNDLVVMPKPTEVVVVYVPLHGEGREVLHREKDEEGSNDLMTAAYKVAGKRMEEPSEIGDVLLISCSRPLGTLRLPDGDPVALSEWSCGYIFRFESKGWTSLLTPEVPAS